MARAIPFCNGLAASNPCLEASDGRVEEEVVDDGCGTLPLAIDIIAGPTETFLSPPNFHGAPPVSLVGIVVVTAGVFHPPVPLALVLPLTPPTAVEPTRLFRDGVLNGRGAVDKVEAAAIPPESLESKFDEGATEIPPTEPDDDPRFEESKSKP